MNRLQSGIIFFLLFSSGVFCQPLYPVQINGLWGAIDSTGKLIVAPKYENELQAVNPRCSFLRVINNKTSMIINSQGKEVIKVDFDIQSWLGHGLFSFSKDTLGQRRCGIIDTNGKIITAAKYIYITPFHKSDLEPYGGKTADVCYQLKEKDKFGNYKETLAKIDTSGRLTATENNYEGLVVFQEPGKRYGAKDTAGNSIIAAKYYLLGDCKNGAMTYSKETRHRSGIIDRKGNEVIPDDGKRIVGYRPFCSTDTLVVVWQVKGEGVSAVYKQADIYTIKGKFLFHCKQPVTMYQAFGMFLLQDDEGKRGLMDGNGNVLVAPKYELLEWYLGGDRMQVKTLNGKYGYIDRKGKEVIPCIYDKAEIFQDGNGSHCKGLARVTLKRGSPGYDIFNGAENGNEKTAYISRTGNVIWPGKK